MGVGREDTPGALGAGPGKEADRNPRGDAGGAQMLMYAGARVDAVTRNGNYTPLHLAARNGRAATVKALLAAGAKVHLIAPRLGPVKPSSGESFEATGTLENSAPVLFDALVLPDGAVGVKLLGSLVEVMDFISNQYRHGKTILALGASKTLTERAGVATTLANGDADPGILLGDPAHAGQATKGFITALGKHRHSEREAGAVLQ